MEKIQLNPPLKIHCQLQSYFFLFKLECFLHSCNNPRKICIRPFLTKKDFMAQIFLKHLMEMCFFIVICLFPQISLAVSSFLFQIYILVLSFLYQFIADCVLCAFQLPSYFLPAFFSSSFAISCGQSIVLITLFFFTLLGPNICLIYLSNLENRPCIKKKLLSAP